jgi:hypothetical protein
MELRNPVGFRLAASARRNLGFCSPISGKGTRMQSSTHKGDVRHHATKDDPECRSGHQAPNDEKRCIPTGGTDDPDHHHDHDEDAEPDRDRPKLKAGG